jgi:hypothetical protein
MRKTARDLLIRSTEIGVWNGIIRVVKELDLRRRVVDVCESVRRSLEAVLLGEIGSYQSHTLVGWVERRPLAWEEDESQSELQDRQNPDEPD